MAGILYPNDEPLTGALFSNPMLARQVAAQRAANPRPDVTKDLAGLLLRPELLGNSYDAKAHLSGMAGTVNQLFHKFGTAENPMGPFGFGGITAYHGSPHRFDKFDMSKVGTGEGAQAYGHGLYFAENPSVAKDYANKLSQGRAALGNKSLDGLSPEAKKIVEYNLFNNDMYRVQRFAAQGEPAYKEAWEFLSKNARPQSNLYKVDLPDDQVAKMLDWDKPLSQQPESVRDALAKLKVGDSEIDGFKELAKTPQGVEMLRSVGIPGIRYLDQGSRAGGKGTSNFVVFDDRIPKIIGKE
jgi:hypothetical protein